MRRCRKKGGEGEGRGGQGWGNVKRREVSWEETTCQELHDSVNKYYQV